MAWTGILHFLNSDLKPEHLTLFNCMTYPQILPIGVWRKNVWFYFIFFDEKVKGLKQMFFFFIPNTLDFPKYFWELFFFVLFQICLRNERTSKIHVSIMYYVITQRYWLKADIKLPYFGFYLQTLLLDALNRAIYRQRCLKVCYITFIWLVTSVDIIFDLVKQIVRTCIE